MALFRAVESAQPPVQRLFFDPLARGFLTSGLRLAAACAGLPLVGSLVPRLIDRRAPGPRISALVRTRLIDDALADGLADGATQVVILGAGYDSRAYRLGMDHGVRVFELDRPATQAIKRARLARIPQADPGHVTFVATDFIEDELSDVLTAAGYDPQAKTFFIWEGVTNYLNAEAVDSTLRWIAGHSVSGSRLSFTYIDRGLLDGSKAFARARPWMARVEQAGEPFTFGLDPDTLSAYLNECGLRLIDDATTADALTRYPERASERPPPAFYHVALAQTDRREGSIRV